MASKNILVENLSGQRLRKRSTNRPAVLHIESYSNTDRPEATEFEPGESIWNTDDLAPNFACADGTWRDAMGNIT